jgi:hypothetical protein
LMSRLRPHLKCRGNDQQCCPLTSSSISILFSRSHSPTKPMSAPLLPPPRNRNPSAEENKSEKVAESMPSPMPRSTVPSGYVAALTPGVVAERMINKSAISSKVRLHYRSAPFCIKRSSL